MWADIHHIFTLIQENSQHLCQKYSMITPFQNHYLQKNYLPLVGRSGLKYLCPHLISIPIILPSHSLFILIIFRFFRDQICHFDLPSPPSIFQFLVHPFPLESSGGFFSPHFHTFKSPQKECMKLIPITFWQILNQQFDNI